jgi:DNA transformation protein and related proteins
MDAAAIEDFFAPFGPVSVRRMFGGAGIYRDGVVFALEVSGEILLKADEQTAPRFAAAGSRQWTYQPKGGRMAAMPYWNIPEGALDDPEEFVQWAQLAFEAGVRTRRR